MQKALTLKILTIAIIGLLLLIPINSVQSQLHERQGYLQHATETVADSWTGTQRILTPILVIPYEVSAPPPAPGFYTNGNKPSVERLSVLTPETMSGEATIKNTRVYKGIYEIPVYHSHIQLTGHFSAERLQQHMKSLANRPHFKRITRPYLSLQLTDMRGVTDIPALQINHKTVQLNPGSNISALPDGLHTSLDPSQLSEDLAFSLQLALRGMKSVSFVPLADNTSLKLQSNWPHPAFFGATLPVDRHISPEGFSASWRTNRYANHGTVAIAQCIVDAQCQPLLGTASGVNFIKPVDIYQQSERSVKYAILFIGLSFITFFVFEIVKRTRIHPIQYALVGFAIAVFYLLLISLAEHIAFYWAYSIAAASCTALMLFYVRYMLKSLASALSFSLMIALLYGLLYVIIQAEDFALLMGSILVFAALSAVMFITRKLDWYDVASVPAQK